MALQGPLEVDLSYGRDKKKENVSAFHKKTAAINKSTDKKHTVDNGTNDLMDLARLSGASGGISRGQSAQGRVLEGLCESGGWEGGGRPREGSRSGEGPGNTAVGNWLAGAN